uniref:Uncharacterized protein n=1 Tax=Daphnia galeata TaxID=27404 RepID=A0A8J2RP02_9CRUS|nr:unnamed protein product [Daphnia galeata]
MKKSENHIQSDSSSDVTEESEEHIPGWDNSSSDEEYTPRSTPRLPMVTLEIPTHSLSKSTGLVAYSRGISVIDHYMIASSYFKGGGGDINEISLSTATVFRQRRENRPTGILVQVRGFIVFHQPHYFLFAREKLHIPFMELEERGSYGDEIAALFSAKTKCRCTHLLAP